MVLGVDLQQRPGRGPYVGSVCLEQRGPRVAQACKHSSGHGQGLGERPGCLVWAEVAEERLASLVAGDPSPGGDQDKLAERLAGGLGHGPASCPPMEIAKRPSSCALTKDVCSAPVTGQFCDPPQELGGLGPPRPSGGSGDFSGTACFPMTAPGNARQPTRKDKGDPHEGSSSYGLRPTNSDLGSPLVFDVQP